MRPLWLGVLGALAFASAGAALYVASARPVVDESGVRVTKQVRHDVTKAMDRIADEHARKPGPRFGLKTDGDASVQLAGKRERPQFVYFIKDGCPCSVEVEPLFHDLWKLHEGKVDFVGVIEGDREVAKRWTSDMLTPYAIAYDPEGVSIQGYGATASAFSALLDREGRIIKMWPGYSAGILREMNDLMARETGETARKLDTKWARKERAAGCAFDFASKVYGDAPKG